MKVICIDNKKRPYNIYDPSVYIKEGNVYLVVSEEQGVTNSGEWRYVMFYLA